MLISFYPLQQVATDDSMSDDVFEEESLKAPTQRGTPSPTGYRDYHPPAEIIHRVPPDDDVPIHKVQFAIAILKPPSLDRSLSFLLSTSSAEHPSLAISASEKHSSSIIN